MVEHDQRHEGGAADGPGGEGQAPAEEIGADTGGDLAEDHRAVGADHVAGHRLEVHPQLALQVGRHPVVGAVVAEQQEAGGEAPEQEHAARFRIAQHPSQRAGAASLGVALRSRAGTLAPGLAASQDGDSGTQGRRARQTSAGATAVKNKVRQPNSGMICPPAGSPPGSPRSSRPAWRRGWWCGTWFRRTRTSGCCRRRTASRGRARRRSGSARTASSSGSAPATRYRWRTARWSRSPLAPGRSGRSTSRHRYRRRPCRRESGCRGSRLRSCSGRIRPSGC